MSYIIKSVSPFASTKLTSKGREKLSKGQLTFSSWSIGDSEINYDRESLVDASLVTGTTKVLRPKDVHPDLKYVITKSNGVIKQPFASNGVRCIKVDINNEADQRGHFTGTLASGFTTQTTLTAYTRTYGTAAATILGGGTSLTLSGVTEGDFLLFKLFYSDYTNETPTPHLWYKAQSVVGSTVTVDRELPNLAAGNVAYFVYKGGEIYDNEPDAVAYWDTGTLSFDSACDITVTDVPIWNMNNVFSEDILGVSGATYEDHTLYGSYGYLGEKDNFLYDPANGFNKSVSVLHYSNKTISSLYGEFFYINDDDNKTVKVHIPDMMYHRRNFSGSTTGDKMGMSFVATGASVSIGSNGQNYVPLVEDPTYINGTPKAVGRVYPNLQLITFDDQEIVAAMSYKSNRNWTLPELELTMVNPVAGVGNGILGASETIYVTYALDNNSGTGITPSLPCQNYASITNTTSTAKDVQFNINDIDLLPYMRNAEGTEGFYADEFQVMYQVTTDGARPDSGSWKVVDFTASALSGSNINALTLETQNPLAVTPNFQLTQAIDATATTYSLVSTLSMAPVVSPDNLQFGDEKFFYGNIEAYIGATIYKTLFKMTLQASDFVNTTNVTRSSDPSTNPPDIRISEVGIYDDDGDLVVISKISDPVKLTAGNTIIIELSMDF